MKTFTIAFILMNTFALKAELPPVILDAQNPGSKIYNFELKSEKLKCSNRDVDVFIPFNQKNLSQQFPVIVYGHGQALNIDHYKLTMEHLAKKGIIAIFPTYDKGFFDQDWIRMGKDYVSLTDCALGLIEKKYNVLSNRDQIIFSGHSKGAYVASVASGLAFKEKLSVKPRSVLLFQSAGVDRELNEAHDPQVFLTVIYSDKDTIVKKSISEELYQSSPSQKKQFITLKSYPELAANHFWPLTQKSIVGGGPEGPFHHYSSWKWLVSAAQDLKDGARGDNPFIYGNKATDKGVSSLKDEIIRNW